MTETQERVKKYQFDISNEWYALFTYFENLNSFAIATIEGSPTDARGKLWQAKYFVTINYVTPAQSLFQCSIGL